MSASVVEQRPNGLKKYLGEIRLANVGNCVAYLYRNGQILRLTKDFALSTNLYEMERLFRMQGIAGMKVRKVIYVCVYVQSI
jgi:serine/threonine protein phosphatase PrpC